MEPLPGLEPPSGVFRRYTFRLYPTVKQEIKLNELLWFQCQVHNAALQERRDAYKKQGTSLDYYHQTSEVTKLRAETDPSDPIHHYGTTVTYATLYRVEKAYRAFFARVKMGQKAGFPRFKSARRYDSVEYRRRAGWKILPVVGKARHGRLHLQGVGHVKLRLHRDLQGEPTTITVVHRAHYWEVSVACRNVPMTPTCLPVPGTEQVVGVDRGVHAVVATSEGLVVENPRHVRKFEKKIAASQRVLSRKRQGSKRRTRALQHYRVLKTREARVRRDFLHKLSRDLARPGRVVVFEELQVNNMTKSARGTALEPGKNVKQKAGLNKSILDVGWGMLYQMVSYKAVEAGGRTETVPAPYTSQTCSNCVHVHAEDRTGRDYVCCRCGFREDADVNAALVVAQRYEKEQMGVSLQ